MWVEGLVLNVLPSDWPALDEYETNAYKRVKITMKSGREA